MSETTPTILDTDATKQTLSFADVMQRVAVDHDKPLTAQLKEMATLCMRGNRLSTEEYYKLRLYNDANLTLEDKKRFAGLARSREIWVELNAANPWQGVMDDKLAFEHLMRGFGFSVPTTLAVIGGKRNAPKPAFLRDKDSVRAFFEAASFPVFGKPLDADQSLGSIKLIGYDPAIGMLSKHDGSLIAVDDFWTEIATNHAQGYLLQDCLVSHKELLELCGSGVPTMRILTLDEGDGPALFTAAAKLTGSNNVADNFWRGGNLIAPVDIESGVMGQALTRMGVDGELCSTHPDTGCEIEGTALPLWQEAKTVALLAAGILKGAAIIGFDMALTDNGPVIIEANYDPDLVMMQAAHGKGLIGERLDNAIAYIKQSVKQEIRDTKRTLKEERRANSEAMRKALSRKSA